MCHNREALRSSHKIQSWLLGLGECFSRGLALVWDIYIYNYLFFLANCVVVQVTDGGLNHCSCQTRLTWLVADTKGVSIIAPWGCIWCWPLVCFVVVFLSYLHMITIIIWGLQFFFLNVRECISSSSLMETLRDGLGFPKALPFHLLSLCLLFPSLRCLPAHTQADRQTVLRSRHSSKIWVKINVPWSPSMI